MTSPWQRNKAQKGKDGEYTPSRVLKTAFTRGFPARLASPVTFLKGSAPPPTSASLRAGEGWGQGGAASVARPVSELRWRVDRPDVAGFSVIVLESV
jgi:hypothetical protein